MWLTHVFPLSIDHSYPENYPTITVATLAVPEFYDYSLTSYSFRVLGLLSEIQLYMEKPPQKPSLEFVFRCEICAMHTNKDPITQWFQENWKSGWSIDLEKFFIILFINNSPTPSPSPRSDHSSSSALKCSKMGSNHNLAGPPNGQLGLFRKPLVPGNNMPSPLDNKMAKQLQGTGNVKSSSQYIYSSPQGLTWESHLTTWAFPLNPETGVQFAKSSIPCPQPWLLNYHLDPSPSFSWSTYNPIEPDAIHWISGHYLQMLNSPFDLLTSSLQLQSINLPTWESFPPSVPHHFSNSVSNSPFNLVTSSPQLQSINLPAQESFTTSLPSPLSNSTPIQSWILHCIHSPASLSHGLSLHQLVLLSLKLQMIRCMLSQFWRSVMMQDALMS